MSDHVVNGGKAFEKWDLQTFEQEGWPKPSLSIAQITSPFLGGTKLLKKSSPVWQLYQSLCQVKNLNAVVLRNPAPTRWLSICSYLMLLIKYEEVYNALWSHPKLEKKHQIHKIAASKWEAAKMLVHELLPLFRLVKHLQRDSNTYLLSDGIYEAGILLVLYQRRLALYKAEKDTVLDAPLATTRVHVVNQIVRTLKVQYNFLFEYDASKEHYVFALLLDPRFCDLDIIFQIRLFEEKNPETFGDLSAEGQHEYKIAQRLKELYIERLKILATEAYLKRVYSPPPAAATSSGLKKKRSFASLEPQKPVPAPTSPSPADSFVHPAIETQWNTYLAAVLSLTDNASKFPLLFWEPFRAQAPDLTRTAECFVPVGKTEVLVEGLFSVTGILTLDRRSRTSVDVLDDVVYIWSNYPRDPKVSKSHRKEERLPIPEFLQGSLLPQFVDGDIDSFAEAQGENLAPDDLVIAEKENDALASFGVDAGGWADLQGIQDDQDPLFDLTDALKTYHEPLWSPEDLNLPPLAGSDFLIIE